jgi:hypothetical protein
MPLIVLLFPHAILGTRVLLFLSRQRSERATMRLCMVILKGLPSLIAEMNVVEVEHIWTLRLGLCAGRGGAVGWRQPSAANSCTAVAHNPCSRTLRKRTARVPLKRLLS